MRRLTFLTAFVLLVAITANTSAADPDPITPEVRKKVYESALKHAEGRAKIERMEKDGTALLASAKVGVIDAKVKDVKIPESPDKKNPIRFPNANAKTKFIEKLEAELQAHRETLKMPARVAEDFGPELYSFEVGSFGSLEGRQKVVKVVDERSAVLQVTLPVRLKGAPPTGKVDVPSARVLLSGVDTSKWADGMGAEMPGTVFVVVGNKKVGNATLLHLAAIKFSEEESKAIMSVAKQEK